jgi:hypothetical protein
MLMRQKFSMFAVCYDCGDRPNHLGAKHTGAIERKAECGALWQDSLYKIDRNTQVER